MKQTEQDPRINASSLTFSDYLKILLICNVTCALLLAVYNLMHGFLHAKFQDDHDLVVYISVGIFVVLASLIISLIVVYARRRYMNRHIQIVLDSARRVASGDYSVRIPLTHIDGKTDEFDVLYEDFNTMAENLSKKTVLGEDFLSNVSHEFKTPLSVITNYITVLDSDSLSAEDRHAYMEKIRDASLRLSDLVGNILKLNRLEQGKIDVQLKSFDLCDALAQSILNFDQPLTEKNIDLTANLDTRIMIDSDEELLSIVFNNLLSNAIKFTPENGQITISAEKADGGINNSNSKNSKTISSDLSDKIGTSDCKYAIVRISDSGCGMSEDTVNHIFDKFYQADTSHSTKGNGIGLTMVSEISRLLHFTIAVDSAPGNGSTFTLKLPLL